MAYCFGDAVQRSTLPGEWSITSRGVTTARERRLCKTATSLIDQSPDGARFASLHAPAVVNIDDLATQDLIITATREERAHIARMAPALRGRTFTLREAVTLGGDVTLTSYDEPEPLLGYSAVLNSRRGRTQIDEPPIGGNLFQSRHHPLDIPDVHFERSKRHLSTLTDLMTAVETFHDQISRYVAPR